MGDLGPNADIAVAVFRDVRLAPGEALALLDHNAFSTGAGAIALWDARQLADALMVAGALSLEGFAANLSMIHPAVAASRPYPGIRTLVGQLRAMLEGSYLWADGAARNLQDPLTFRGLPQTLGALRDGLDYASAQLAVELNASQGNPIVALDEERVISVANFDVIPLAAALDFVRISLAPALTSGAERTLKLLSNPWSGLPPGLNPEGGAGLGLAELGVAQQALVAEARLLAQPVSYEVASTSLSEGIEDRITLAPLSAHRVAHVVSLGWRCAAIELVVAAQAVDVRGVKPLGKGTAEAFRLVREQVPVFRATNDFPSDLDPLVAVLRDGRLSRIVDAAHATSRP
jgi:histidine ammonia-lyase